MCHKTKVSFFKIQILSFMNPTLFVRFLGDSIYLTDPYYFCLFCEGHFYKIFHLNKKLLIYGPKKTDCCYLQKGSLEHFEISGN